MVQEEKETGRRTKLLGRVHSIGININNILGSGIVTAPGVIWKAIKCPWIVLLLWLGGGIISLVGSSIYAEMGAINKKSGGEAKYLHLAFPEPQFMMSYIFSFMYIFAIRPSLICAVLQSAAQYFWYAVNGQSNNELDKNGWSLSASSPFWSIKLTAIAFLFIITIYHMISNKLANNINQSITVIKLITYLVISIAGVYKLIKNWPESKINWKEPLSGTTSISDYSTSIILVLFSYDGWNSVNYSISEVKNPEENLIYSNVISVGIVTTLYLFVNVALISVVPDESITKINDEIIFSVFFRQLFGSSEVVARIFTGLVVISVIGTATTQVWSGSRVIVGVAELGFFFPKYSKELRTWNDRFDTPVNALFVQFIWCSIIIIFIGSSLTVTSFTFFSTFSMYSYWIFYLATGLGLLAIRNRYKNEEKKQKKQVLKNLSSNLNAPEAIELNGPNASEIDLSIAILVESPVVTEPENPSNLKTIDLGAIKFKVPTPIVLIFILAGLFMLMLTFSFVIDNNRIQKLLPIFISYGLICIAILLWRRKSEDIKRGIDNDSN